MSQKSLSEYVSVNQIRWPAIGLGLHGAFTGSFLYAAILNPTVLRWAMVVVWALILVADVRILVRVGERFFHAGRLQALVEEAGRTKDLLIDLEASMGKSQEDREEFLRSFERGVERLRGMNDALEKALPTDDLTLPPSDGRVPSP